MENGGFLVEKDVRIQESHEYHVTALLRGLSPATIGDSKVFREKSYEFSGNVNITGVIVVATRTIKDLLPLKIGYCSATFF